MGILGWAAKVIKEDFGNRMQKAKQEQETKTLQLEYVGGLTGYKGSTLRLQRYRDQTRIDSYQARIVSVQWQEQHERSIGRAAAGAIIGGVLTGGIGVIAGAAIGGRKADTSLAVITADIAGTSYTIYVRCSAEEFKDLAGF